MHVTTVDMNAFLLMYKCRVSFVQSVLMYVFTVQVMNTRFNFLLYSFPPRVTTINILRKSVLRLTNTE